MAESKQSCSRTLPALHRRDPRHLHPPRYHRRLSRRPAHQGSHLCQKKVVGEKRAEEKTQNLDECELDAPKARSQEEGSQIDGVSRHEESTGLKFDLEA